MDDGYGLVERLAFVEWIKKHCNMLKQFPKFNISDFHSRHSCSQIVRDRSG